MPGGQSSRELRKPGANGPDAITSPGDFTAVAERAVPLLEVPADGVTPTEADLEPRVETILPGRAQVSPVTGATVVEHPRSELPLRARGVGQPVHKAFGEHEISAAHHARQLAAGGVRGAAEPDTPVHKQADLSAYLITSQKMPAIDTKPSVKTSVLTYGTASR